MSDDRVDCPAENRWYCLQPADGWVPDPDMALARKLWLEADEAGFLAAANEFVLRRREGWAYVSQMAHDNCRCYIEFEFVDAALYLETLEEARAWAERQNWDVELTMDDWSDSGLVRCLEPDSRWARAILPEPSYEVNGRPTDRRTVELLRQVFDEHRQRTDEILSSLDCPIELRYREGICSVEGETDG